MQSPDQECGRDPGIRSWIISGARLGRVLCVFLALMAVGCTEFAPRPSDLGPLQLNEVYPIFAADDALTNRWQRFKVWGETEFKLVALNDEIAIRATGEGASGALARWIEIDTAICPVAEWSWRVDSLPETADLSDRNVEDVAASLFFAFGDPGTLSNPQPVPTLRYAWASTRNSVESIVDSPYFPGKLRTIVVRSGTDELGDWVIERRNMRTDYLRAFGRLPREPVQVMALFTDNDHTKAPAEAFYSWARVRCSRHPDAFPLF